MSADSIKQYQYWSEIEKSKCLSKLFTNNDRKLGYNTMLELEDFRGLHFEYMNVYLFPVFEICNKW